MAPHPEPARSAESKDAPCRSNQDPCVPQTVSPTRRPIASRTPLRSSREADDSAKKLQMTIGPRLGGQTTATSLVAPFWAVPVLSATSQVSGKPARNRLSPVLLPTSQAVNCSRAGSESALPRTILRRRSEEHTSELQS